MYDYPRSGSTHGLILRHQWVERTINQQWQLIITGKNKQLTHTQSDSSVCSWNRLQQKNRETKLVYEQHEWRDKQGSTQGKYLVRVQSDHIHHPGKVEDGLAIQMGMSENEVYPQWNSHLVGVMISKTIGFRGTQHFQTHPYVVYLICPSFIAPAHGTSRWKMAIYSGFCHFQTSPNIDKPGPSANQRWQFKAPKIWLFFAIQPWDSDFPKRHNLATMVLHWAGTISTSIQRHVYICVSSCIYAVYVLNTAYILWQ